MMLKQLMMVCAAGLCWAATQQAWAEEPTQRAPSNEALQEEPWLEPIPIPFDPELEQQIQEVQDALGAIHRQMVRRKETIDTAQDPAKKAALYAELETLRKEREDLEALLHDLVDEAKASQRTTIDEALARAKWLERQQDYQEQKEELIRDRQQ